MVVPAAAVPTAVVPSVVVGPAAVVPSVAGVGAVVVGVVVAASPVVVPGELSLPGAEGVDVVEAEVREPLAPADELVVAVVDGALRSAAWICDASCCAKSAGSGVWMFAIARPS